MRRCALPPAPAPFANVIRLTDLPAADRHHVPHRITNHFEEIDMSKHIGSFDLRGIVEKALAGAAFAATVAVISAGTAAMCFPGLVA
jgi:hypothetical protein